jgi:NADPH2:quinone reductase
MGPHRRDRVKVGRVPVRLDLMHAGVIPTTGLTALQGVDDAFHPATARRFSRGCIDAALALAGGDALERCLHAARPGGRVAYPNGVEPEPRPRENIKVISYDAISGVRQFERLGPAIEAAKLEVPIAASYPLAEAARAHERLAAGHVLGKIVLRIR